MLKFDVWRHSEEDPGRDSAVKYLTDMLQDLAGWSRKNKIALAPVIGVGCPGVIDEDGSIERGSQNLPGNWESSRFNLPRAIREGVPKIGEDETMIVMHNDAVVQGLSELPYARDKLHWGVLTIGTGLGNARYTTRKIQKRRSK